jgi:uncharacterized protein (TIGR02145 family)
VTAVFPITTEQTFAAGTDYEGGKIFYVLQSGDPGYVAGEINGLIASLSDSSGEWGCSGTFIDGLSNVIGSGNQNTINIMNNCSTAGIAARLSGDLVSGGYNDWYLPSYDELKKLTLVYQTLGINFSIIPYYTSSQFISEPGLPGSLYAYSFFIDGTSHVQTKTSIINIRPIRSFNFALVVPTLTTQSATSITQTTATLNGNITDTGGENPTVRGFEYGTTTSYGTTTNDTTGSYSTGAYTRDINNLACSTLYYYRAIATNSIGTGLGNQQTFTTSACTNVIPTVSTPTSISITKNSATLGANVTSLGFPASISARGICYGTSPSPTNCVAEGSTTTGVYTQSITGLTPNTTYYYRGYATNTTGAAYSSDATFTTSPAWSCGETVTGLDSLTYGTVLAEDGRCWLDRNLGATRQAQSFDDYQSYGSLFQWGRGADGHELITHTSATAATPVNGSTITLATSDTPANNLFVESPFSPFDWRNPQNDNLWQGVNGTNNVCPAGFRLPTQPEWSTFVSNAGITNYTTAYNSLLKLTTAGYRSYTDASLKNIGTLGYYWSSGTSNTIVSSLYFDSSNIYPNSYFFRAFGLSVRCIQVTPPTITTQSATSVTQTTATLNGNITDTGGENPTVRGFEYGTTTNYGTTSSDVTGSYSTGAYTKDITSLTCGTTYHYRANATNSVGTTNGNDVSFTTSACASGGGGGGGSSGGGGGGGGGLVITPPVVVTPTTPIPSTSVICNIGQVFSPTTGKRCTSFTAVLSTPSSTPNITRTLKLTTPRMTGDDVKQLQVYLVSKGYDIGTPDGVYGTKSSMAIAKFQRENNLKPDGALGPVTRGLLFK